MISFRAPGWIALVALFSAPVVAQQVDTQALPRMVATERAFAAAAAELGTRNSFLTFFADDAVSLDGGATGAAAKIGRAKDALIAAPPTKLPVLSRLMWQPFAGQISEDGTLGWLTGPYAVLVLTTKDVTAKGAYFSVWKREADGTYRVWLDEGIALPDVWSGASDFRAAAQADVGSVGAADETIDQAEHAVASGGDAWSARLAASVRLHREGVMPMAGRDGIAAWAHTAWTSVHYVVLRNEKAASGDLGVALGGYDATTPAGAEHGTFVRVWQRDVQSHWRIVFETSKKVK
jgi:hypothetical protein